MKSFNHHSGSRGCQGVPRFIKGIYWATGLFLRTPFMEGCAGANKKALPPGRQQEQASKQRCTFSSVQFRAEEPTKKNPQQRCTFSPTTFSSVLIPVKPALTHYPAQRDGLSSNLTVAAFSHGPMRGGFFSREVGHVCRPAVSA